MIVHVQHIVSGDRRLPGKVHQFAGSQLARGRASFLEDNADEGHGLAVPTGAQEEPDGIIKAHETKVPRPVAPAAEGAGDFVAH